MLRKGMLFSALKVQFSCWSRCSKMDRQPVCANCKDNVIIPEIIYDSVTGESTCSGCSQVLAEQRIDQGSEWRNFADSDKDRSRVGSNDPYFGTSLSTQMGPGKSKQSQQISQLHNKISFDTKSRNLSEAFSKLSAMCDKIKVSQSVQDRAKRLYSEYESKRGRSMRTGGKSEGLIMGIIYHACKEVDEGRTFLDLSKHSGVPESEIRKNVRRLSDILDSGKVDSALKPEDLVERFCGRMPSDLPEWLKIGAAGIASMAASKAEGKKPASIACASILMACKLAEIPSDEEEIANASNEITAATVRATYQLIAVHMKEIVPQSLLDKIKQYKADPSIGKFKTPMAASASSSQHITHKMAPLFTFDSNAASNLLPKTGNPIGMGSVIEHISITSSSSSSSASSSSSITNTTNTIITTTETQIQSKQETIVS